MADNTPVWLLDIDGVINAAAVRHRLLGSWPAGQWKSGRVSGFHIEIARPVIDFLDRVHTEGLAEIRWHTTWQDKAPLVGAAFGLPVWPVHHAPEFLSGRYPQYGAKHAERDWWKLPGALRVVEQERRPLVWTDDDATVLRIVTRARLKEGPTLVVAPHPNLGLLQADLDRIDAFLKELQ